MTTARSSSLYDFNAHSAGSVFDDLIGGSRRRSSLASDSTLASSPPPTPTYPGRGGLRTYRRGDFKSGRGRGGHESPPPSRAYEKPFYTRERSGSKRSDTGDNFVQDYNQSAPPYQPREFGALSVEDNPLWQPVKFSRSDQVLFKNKDEILSPEAADVNARAPASAVCTSNSVEHSTHCVQSKDLTAAGIRWQDDPFFARYRLNAGFEKDEQEDEAPSDHGAAKLPNTRTRSQRARQRNESHQLAIPNPVPKQGKVVKIKVQPEMSAFCEEEQYIRAFIKEGFSSLQLAPMTKQRRKLFTALARPYNVTCESTKTGKGMMDTITLRRTAKTRLVGDDEDENGSDAGDDEEEKQDEGGGAVVKVERRRYREGEVLGPQAPKIPPGNVGYQLLEGMGWSDGERIGATKGLEAPLTIVLKWSRLGLGAPIKKKKPIVAV